MKGLAATTAVLPNQPPLTAGRFTLHALLNKKRRPSGTHRNQVEPPELPAGGWLRSPRLVHCRMLLLVVCCCRLCIQPSCRLIILTASLRRSCFQSRGGITATRCILLQQALDGASHILDALLLQPRR